MRLDTQRRHSTMAATVMQMSRASRSRQSRRTRTTCARDVRLRVNRNDPNDPNARTIMATATIDGIETRFDVIGSGPPLLMMSPGGFDATLEKWRTQGVYTRLKLLDHLPRHYTCIVYDRRESGESGGRVE